MNSGAVINAISLRTANDVTGRDPTSCAVYGWTTLYPGSGSVAWKPLGSTSLLPAPRKTGLVTALFENRSAYRTFQVVFPGSKSAGESHTQFSDIAFAEILLHKAYISRAPGGNAALLFEGVLLNSSTLQTATGAANGPTPLCPPERPAIAPPFRDSRASAP